MLESHRKFTIPPETKKKTSGERKKYKFAKSMENRFHTPNERLSIAGSESVQTITQKEITNSHRVVRINYAQIGGKTEIPTNIAFDLHTLQSGYK